MKTIAQLIDEWDENPKLQINFSEHGAVAECPAYQQLIEALKEARDALSKYAGREGQPYADELLKKWGVE